MLAAPSTSVRLPRLREVAARALDESLAGCSPDEFCDGFGLGDAHRGVLCHVYEQAQACVRANTLAECDVLFGEVGADESLDRLDALVEQQPELPDGTRLPLASAGEATAMIANAAVPAKRAHKLALQQALQQVEAENASLQAQYLAALPELHAASQEIAACKALVEKTATSAEGWRAANA